MKYIHLKSPALALLAVTALSATSIAGAGALREVKAGAYRSDPDHTQIVFSLLHLGFTEYTGIFSGATGSLQLDPTKIEASKLNISIPVQSITTTSAKLTEELKGDQWFNTAQFPTATFVSTSISPAADGSFKVSGNLTLHGVTKPLVLVAHFVGAGVNPVTKTYTVGFEASTLIKRGDFGISAYLPMLGGDVTLKIAGAFETQS
jgi:polyisoprenoid-binding protein YceI